MRRSWGFVLLLWVIQGCRPAYPPASDGRDRPRGSWHRSREVRQEPARAEAIATWPRRRVVTQTDVDQTSELGALQRLDVGARATEVELSRELERLDVRAREMTRVAELHRHHLRSKVLADRDNDQPRSAVLFPIAADDVPIPRMAPFTESATEIDISITEPRTQRFADLAIAANVAREAVATQLAAVRRIREAIGARRNVLQTGP